MIDLLSNVDFINLCIKTYKNSENYSTLLRIFREGNSVPLRYFIEDELDKYNPYIDMSEKSLEKYKMDMIVYSYMMEIINAQLENGEKEFT